MPLYRVTVRTTSPGAGGDCMNVLHIRTAGTDITGSDTDLGEAMTALETCYDAMKNVFPPGSVHHIGDSVIADPYGSPTYYAFTPVTSDAADEGAVAPPHLAICVGLRTTSATRRGRGRVFIGPLNSLAMQTTDGTVNTDRLAMVTNAWAAFVADSVTANGWGLVVWSDLDSLARDVVSSSVRDSLAVMRSRRP
jgi:hypothetical protein